MQSIAVISDVHGRSDWKRIVDYCESKYDCKYIFLGDYFDSFDISAGDQIHNFLEIMSLYESGKCTLLGGNHDFHQYVYGDRCSGFQEEHHMLIKSLLDTHKDSFYGCVGISNESKKILFSHAGVSKTWCERANIPILSEVEELASIVDLIYSEEPALFNFKGDRGDFSGRSNQQSPIWIRPDNMIRDGLAFTQIVGHTQARAVRSVRMFNGEWLWLTDAPGSGQFLIVDEELNIKIEYVPNFNNLLL